MSSLTIQILVLNIITHQDLNTDMMNNTIGWLLQDEMEIYW